MIVCSVRLAIEFVISWIKIGGVRKIDTSSHHYVSSILLWISVL